MLKKVDLYFFLFIHEYTLQVFLADLFLITEWRTLRHVGLFHNARTAIPIRQALETLNRPQPATPIKTDNFTAKDYVSKKLRQKRSKSWDMRFQKHHKVMRPKYIHMNNCINHLKSELPPKCHSLREGLLMQESGKISFDSK